MRIPVHGIQTWCDSDSNYSQANYPLYKVDVSRPFKNLVTSTTTYGTLRPQAYFHYHTEEGRGPQVTLKHLRKTVGQHEQDKHKRLTNEPPSITRLMYLHPRRRDVRGITEEGKPHIFDMQIVERFVKRAVEFVSLTKNVGW